jgi:hypothetical protein
VSVIFVIFLVAAEVLICDNPATANVAAAMAASTRYRLLVKSFTAVSLLYDRQRE